MMRHPVDGAHEPYDVLRGTCPSCGSGEVVHMISVEAYAALGAFGAAVRAHLSGAYAESLSHLVDRAFAGLGP